MRDLVDRATLVGKPVVVKDGNFGIFCDRIVGDESRKSVGVVCDVYGDMETRVDFNGELQWGHLSDFDFVDVLDHGWIKAQYQYIAVDDKCEKVFNGGDGYDYE